MCKSVIICNIWLLLNFIYDAIRSPTDSHTVVHKFDRFVAFFLLPTPKIHNPYSDKNEIISIPQKLKLFIIDAALHKIRIVLVNVVTVLIGVSCQYIHLRRIRHCAMAPKSTLVKNRKWNEEEEEDITTAMWTTLYTSSIVLRSVYTC